MVKISVGEFHAMAEGAAEWGWLSGYEGIEQYNAMIERYGVFSDDVRLF